MSTHRALLFDDDQVFLELLEESLKPCGFSIHAVRHPGEAALEDLLSDAPDLILIAVDLPGKEGFALFTRVRGLTKRTPIALATSTLSATEMSLHAKLRLHADLYLNKHALTPDRLRDVLAPLLPGSVLPGGETAQRVPMQSRTGRIPEWLADVVEETADQALPGWFPEARAPRGDPVTDPVAAGWIAQLEAECDRLQAALDEARRDASSSPFSGEILSLREELSQATAKIAHLELEVGHRDTELARTERTLPELEERLAEVVREKEEALVRAMQLEEQLDDGQRALRQLEGEKRAVEQDLVNQQERAAESLLEADAELRELRARLAQLETEAERDRSAHVGELSKLRADKQRSLAAVEKRANEQLKQAEREHARLLGAMQETLESERRALEQTRRDALARAADADATLERERAEARREVENAEAAASRAVAETRKKIEKRLEQTERAHADLVAALRRKHEQEKEELQTTHRAELRARKGAWDAALGRAVESVRAKEAAKLERAEREHEEALASLQRQHLEDKRALESAREAALARQGEADARAGEAERGLQAQLGQKERLEAEVAQAQREVAELRSALAASARELGERDEMIASLRALVDDLQRAMAAHDPSAP